MISVDVCDLLVDVRKLTSGPLADLAVGWILVIDSYVVPLE